MSPRSLKPACAGSPRPAAYPDGACAIIHIKHGLRLLSCVAWIKYKKAPTDGGQDHVREVNRMEVYFFAGFAGSGAGAGAGAGTTGTGAGGGVTAGCTAGCGGCCFFSQPARAVETAIIRARISTMNFFKTFTSFRMVLH